MQYRIWAEMISGRLHLDLDNPPSTSMFTSAGQSQPAIKKSASVTQVIAEAANILTSLLVAPKQSTSASTTGNGPSVVIENRSKLYQQLSKLSNLRSANILTEEEYILE